MRDIVLKLKNISYISGDYKVIGNINVSIEKNTFTAIIGKSGAGKSTLLKLMAGLLLPTIGDLRIFSKNIHKIKEQIGIRMRRNIGYVFQDGALLSNLSIKENLMLPLNFHKKYLSNELKLKMVTDILKSVDLNDSLELRPAQLSMGEIKLVAIARAMILQPEILFLDEALSSIDPSSAKKMAAIIHEYSNKEWTTVIAVTYSKNLVEKTADRIIVVDNKTISVDDKKENILIKDFDRRPKILNDILF